jgi:hypothetical protein
MTNLNTTPRLNLNNNLDNNLYSNIPELTNYPYTEKDIIKQYINIPKDYEKKEYYVALIGSNSSLSLESSIAEYRFDHDENDYNVYRFVDII